MFKLKKNNSSKIFGNYCLLTLFLSSYTVYGGLPDIYSKMMFSLALLVVAYLFIICFIRYYDSANISDCSLEEKKKIKVQIITYIIIIILFTFVQIIVGWNQYTITFRY